MSRAQRYQLKGLELSTMTIHQLRDIWEKVFGWRVENSTKRPFLLCNLQYEQQAQQYGGLSKATLRQLQELDDRLERNPNYLIDQAGPLYKAGTRLIRDYQGKRYEITVTDQGYLYGDHEYPSLSAVARKITGTQWNGKLFFGLKTKSDHA